MATAKEIRREMKTLVDDLEADKIVPASITPYTVIILHEIAAQLAELNETMIRIRSGR